MNCRSSVGLALGFVAVLGASAARADELPARIELHNRSLMHGFAKADLPLLRRVPGRGPTVTAMLLRTRLTAAGALLRLDGAVTSEEHSERKARIDGGGGWSILVRGDGTSARVSNYGYLLRSARVEPSQRLSVMELERLGETFIRTQLAGIVEFSPEDALIALKTEYESNAISGARERSKNSRVGNDRVWT